MRPHEQPPSNPTIGATWESPEGIIHKWSGTAWLATSLEGPEDEVNSPSHYRQGDIECIDAIEAALTPDEFRGYLKGNIIKYIWRERHKQQGVAVAKGGWYLARLNAFLSKISS